jgi:V8-like Glu-specific endopeptidase
VHENKLEKVFGDESFKTYKWYMTGADRCLAVARIGRDTSKGFGTGFLLKGNALHHSLGDELVLITNAHVVSDDPREGALRSQEAIIIFEALNRDEEFRVGEIFWSSSSKELDATVIRFSQEDQERLKTLTKDVRIYPVSKYLPIIDSEGTNQRIYIIGHPLGGTLQLSFQDNLLLDHEDPKIHYRTPTVGGSSGSPVFNQQWDLIGLHHAGSTEMNCLNGKPGTYEANEGIWIQSVKNALTEVFG